MESAGPRTRSKARGGVTAMPASAAPATRKSTRSTRKSMPAQIPHASPPKPARNEEQAPPVEHADDTATAADVPEAAAQVQEAAPTPAAEAHGTPAPAPGSAAIGGLTPVLGQTPGETPADFGPSPVMPVKLDSLWTPQAAQQQDTNSSSSPYAGFSPLATAPDAQQAAAAAAGGAQHTDGLTPDNSGVDLASMFISTPAEAPAAARSGSPIAGLMAGETPAAPGTGAGVATGSKVQQQQQMETPSAYDSVLMGSPALPGTFAFAGVAASAGATPGSPAALPAAELEDGTTVPQPSAPMLSPAAAAGIPGTPGWSVDTDLPPAQSPSCAQTHTQPGGTPAAAAGVTPGSVCGGMRSAVKTPAGTGRRTPAKATPAAAGTAAKSTPGMSPLDGSPLPPPGSPDFSDVDGDLPPAPSPMLGAGADGLESPLPPAGSPMLGSDGDLTPGSLPPATSPMLSLAGTPAGGAAGTPMSVQQQRQRGTPAAAAATPAAAEGQEDAEMTGEGEEQQYEQQQEVEAAEAEAQILQHAEADVDMIAQQLQAVPTESGSTEQQQHEEHGDVSMQEEELLCAAEEEADSASLGEQEQEGDESAMDAAFGSPAGGFSGAAGTPHSTPAAAAGSAAVTSPGGVTSPGTRYRSSSAKTAAPPKSALAKPKTGGSSSAAPKHAHVVVPDASKTTPPARSTAGRTAPGSAAERFTDTQKQQGGGSPGHTPFPSKAKVRAATAAAGRSTAPAAAAAAAAGSKGPSHKKEMALAAAHSALKRYSKATAEAADSPDAGTPSPAAGSSMRRSSTSPSPSTIPNVSSRLMQPTAASLAKSRNSGASEGPDAVMWSPPKDSPVKQAAAAGSSRPRLASKIVVPSPAAAGPADPSLKALKRSIKSKVAEKAQATLQEGRADALEADAVRSSKLAGSSSSSGRSKALKASRKAAAAAAEEELDLDTYGEEGDEEGYYEEGEGDVDALADTLAGLSVKPLNVAQPKGPLKGVAAPAGRHFKFDDAGNAQETPVSRQRRAPTHIKFDDDGNPIRVAPAAAAPRWR